MLRNGSRVGRPLFMIPCEFCGSSTGLKTKEAINRRLRESSGVYCKASCKRHIVVSRECATCGSHIKSTHSKNGKRQRFCSKECYTTWQASSANANQNHPNWRGGYNRDDRYKQETRTWRKAVYERDSYTCRRCAVKGGRLNAHHLKCWSEYPDERYNVDNGVTLCSECHKWVHSNGNSSNEYLVGNMPNRINISKRNEARLLAPW